jgi:hypothetical protein
MNKKLEADTTTTDIVTAEGEVLPTFSAEMFGDDVMGYSEKSEDSLVPVLAILQDQSGEVKKKHEKYIEGAESGMCIIRALQMLFPSDRPIVFQPCGFTHEWVEWTGEPGEGGAPVGMFPFEERPAEAKEVVNATGKKEWRMANNNRLVETRHHYGNVVNDGSIIPVVIAMSGTNHGTSRQWTALMKSFQVPGTNKKAPAFSRTYLITTAFNQRGTQSWYKFRVQDNGWVTDQNLLQAGFGFAKAIAANEVKAGMDSDAVDSVEDDEIPI